MIACYARVSTDEQNLSRQINSVLHYSNDRLGADVGPPIRFAEHAELIADGATSPVDVGDATVYFDKATGTNLNRDGHQQLMDRVREDPPDAVVVHSLSRLSRSIRDLDRTAEAIVQENECELHIINESFELVPGDQDPMQKAMFRMLGVFAELEAEMAQQRTREGIATRMNNDEYHHGPAPLGFKKNDGKLIEAANFDRVRAVLEMVDGGELSKRKAARELDTSRRTIGRALERGGLYGL